MIKQIALVLALAAPSAALAQGSCGGPEQIAAGLAAVEARDFEPALGLLLPCAEAGDPAAQTAVGDFSYFGRVVAHDLAEAARWYGLAADQGFADAQYYLGQMYLNGMGVGANDAEAARLYRLAADQAQPEATYELGTLYLYGYGVTADDNEALALFRVAADLGVPAAYYRIGAMYEFGRAVERDIDAAQSFYHQAAELGNTDAMLALATMYLTSAGGAVQRDEPESYFWFRLAEAYGSPRGIGRMGELELALSDSQIRATDDRVRAWLQTH